MEKIVLKETKRQFSVFFLLLFLFVIPPMNGASLMVDNFDYSAGDLYNQGDWWKYGSNPNSPIQVVNDALTYPVYQATAIGKAAKIANVATGQDLQKKFTVGDDKIIGGTLYFSALMKVEDMSDVAPGYFMCLTGGNYSGSVTDGKSGSECGKLFVKPASAGKFFFGISRAGATPEYTTQEYSFGATYLVVVKYEFVEGTTNDKVKIFVNPESATLEPTTAGATYETGNDGEASTKYGLQAVELRQGTTSTKAVPNVVVDALRVATDYASLFNPSAPVVVPKITLSAKTISHQYAFKGEVYTDIIIVKGSDLKGDITISGLTSGEVTIPTTTISKADAESADGFSLTTTFTPVSVDKYSETILFDSEGAAQQKVSMYWSTTVPEKVATLLDLSAKKPADYGTYEYTGEGIVSHVDGKSYYLQDATGAIRINDSFGDIVPALKRGDKITGIICTVESSFGLYAVPAPGTPIKLIASDQSVSPVTLTLATLNANPAQYFNQLIKVEKVQFKDVAGGTFTEDLLSPDLSDATGAGKMKIFKGTDIIGTVIPTGEFDIVGISTSASVAIVAPRNLSDLIVPKLPEALEITSEKIFLGSAAPLNVTTQYVKFKVKATSLAAPVVVSLSGANRNMFTVSPESIPAGTSEKEIILTYTPTAIAKHKCQVNFECTNALLNQAFTINAVCIDPLNPPTLTVNSASLTKFNAKVGAESKQTITVTTANLPDFGSVKLMGEGEGSFLINNTVLMKNGNADIIITFKPKKEGTFTERIEFSSLELETTYISVSGSATAGPVVEEKEGDDLPLSTLNPYKLLNETFNGVTKNKPISIVDWKNVAQKGTRAWWGYEYTNEEGIVEKVAKITPYDSKVAAGASTPCEMLFVTPPLDFKNSSSKIFTFRVMGDFLIEGQTDLLEVCYIDMDNNEMYIDPIQINIPATPDMNKEWLEYHMDLTGQNISDTFFIGFRFKSNRGTDNSATYYIDDVSYGRTDIPQVLPSVTQLAFESIINTDYTSEKITITTKNITEPVELTLGGPNKSKFALSTATIPTTGGEFSLSFNSDVEGVHEAYIKVSSRGAADVFIPISAKNKKTDGVDCINFVETPDVLVYDIMGRRIKEIKKCSSFIELNQGLEPGYYMIISTTADGVKTTKIKIQ
ncbi:MAG: hypothetical protein RSB34_09335 [Muribaculaceae bacterium]